MNDYYPTQPGEPNQPVEMSAVQEPRKATFAYGKQILSVCLGVVAITLITLIAQVVILALIQALAPDVMERDWFRILYSTLPMYCIGMPLSYFIFRLGDAHKPQSRGRITVWVLLGLLAVAFACSLAGNLIGTMIQAVLSFFTGEPPTNELLNLTVQTPLWANLLFAGILAPILEELFYRKLVIDRLRVFGDLTAILVSGVLFGLVHGNINQFLYATAFGVMAGFVYVYTGKIRYTMALHMGLNLIGGVFTTELTKILGMADPNVDLVAQFTAHPIAALLYLGYLGFMIACFAVAPVVIVLLRHYMRTERRPGTPTFSTTLKLFAVNPAFWILAVLLVVMFLV